MGSAGCLRLLLQKWQMVYMTTDMIPVLTEGQPEGTFSVCVALYVSKIPAVLDTMTWLTFTLCLLLVTSAGA